MTVPTPTSSPGWPIALLPFTGRLRRPLLVHRCSSLPANLLRSARPPRITAKAAWRGDMCRRGWSRLWRFSPPPVTGWTRPVS